MISTKSVFTIKLLLEKVHTLYIYFASAWFMSWIKGRVLWCFQGCFPRFQDEKSNDSASLKNPRMAQRALIASYLGKPVCFIGQPDHHCNYKKCFGNTSGRFSVCKPILFKDLDTNANHRKTLQVYQPVWWCIQLECTAYHKAFTASPFAISFCALSLSSVSKHNHIPSAIFSHICNVHLCKHVTVIV